MTKKLTKEKAEEMLKNPPHGHPLTEKQRRFFGAISSGAPLKKYDDGGEMSTETPNIVPSYEDVQVWNNFLDYFNKRVGEDKITDEELDRGEGTYAKSIFDEFKNQNNVAYEYDPIVRKMQKYFNDLYTYGDPIANLSVKGKYPKSELSGIDGRVGSQTRNYYIPTYSYFSNDEGGSKKSYIGLLDPHKGNLQVVSSEGMSPEEIQQNYSYMRSERIKKANKKIADEALSKLKSPIQSYSNGGWLDKYEEGGEFLGTTNAGFDYNPSWKGRWEDGGELEAFQLGGVLPGVAGWMYARQGTTPSEGKNARKTTPSAQKGKQTKKAEPIVPQGLINAFHAAEQKKQVQEQAQAALRERMGIAAPTSQTRNIHTNRPVITPTEDFVELQKQREESALTPILEREQAARDASQIALSPETMEMSPRVVGIEPTASPIDAAVLGAGALYSGGIGLLGSMAELANPIPIPKKGISQVVNMLKKNWDIENLSSPSALNWMKNWYGDEETLKRVGNVGNLNTYFNPRPNQIISEALNNLEKYQNKNYIDLLKDKGINEYLEKIGTTGGVSYGVPEGIYVNRIGYFPFNKKGLESVRAHELTHLIETNGIKLSKFDNDALLKPFGENSSSVFGQSQTPEQIFGKTKAYYIDPTEIHARMNQARFDLGLTPKDKFTSRMFDLIGEENGWYGMGKYIKDKNEFIKLMNNFWAVPPAVGLGAVGLSSQGESEVPQQDTGGKTDPIQKKINKDYTKDTVSESTYYRPYQQGKPPTQQEIEEARTYRAPQTLTPVEIVATPSTPAYRNDPQSRREDLSRIPGLSVQTMRNFPRAIQQEYMKALVAQRLDYEGLKDFAMIAPTVVGPSVLSNKIAGGLGKAIEGSFPSFVEHVVTNIPYANKVKPIIKGYKTAKKIAKVGALPFVSHVDNQKNGGITTPAYYQHGLDWQPRTISQKGTTLPKGITPEYLEKLKTFENRPDNLGYHVDNKGIPTIGWGHRLTPQEIKSNTIKIGNEVIPVNKFDKQHADSLLQQDVVDHYNRVPQDIWSKVPEGAIPYILDSVYNRGSLSKQSRNYIEKGDIAGLSKYYSDAAKDLSGGAKTRMQWRAENLGKSAVPTNTFQAPISPYPIMRDNTYVQRPIIPMFNSGGSVKTDNMGYWNPENWGKPVRIDSNDITMKGVDVPLYGISNTGDRKMMYPGQDYKFKGSSVTEYPMAKYGINQLDEKTEEHLDNLLNFTNKPSKKGWLEKYS